MILQLRSVAIFSARASSILAKLEVHSQLQALAFALRYEVVEVRRPDE